MKDLISTYSIIAVDRKNGLMGGAVQSHYFSAGAAVLWAEPEAGVVATQAMANLNYGPGGLALLRKGLSPEQVITKLTKEDQAGNMRQAACIAPSGESFAFTGSGCIEHASHITGEDFSAQGNMLFSDRVVPEMAEAFQDSRGPLWDRLLAALNAAEQAGGDVRGKQAAGILIVQTKPSGDIGTDRFMDLRVEDHIEPLTELSRLVKIHQAYHHGDLGDKALEMGDMLAAEEEYAIAESLCPGNIELRYWHGVALANNDKKAEAVKILGPIYQADDRWQLLSQRLVKAGILKKMV